MPRQREHPFSWSCLKLFLDRENLPGLSLGLGGVVKGELLISSRLSLVGVRFPDLQNFSPCPPSGQPRSMKSLLLQWRRA